MTSPAPSSISATEAGWRTAATVAALLAGLLVLDRAAGAVLGWTYARSGASPVRAVAEARPDTVVVGTSSAKYAIDPRAWAGGRLVNLAQDGQTILFSIAAGRVLADAPGVKRIIIGIDPYDLNSGLANPSAPRVWRIAPSVATIPEIASMLAATRPDTAPLLAVLRTWPYRGALDEIWRGLRRPAPPAYVALRPGPVEASPPDPPGFNLPFSATLDPYIPVLAEIARRPGLEVVLVTTPAYRDDRAARPAQKALLATLVGRLKGAPVCDLTGVDTPALAALRDNPAHFKDAIHLSGPAAALYTAELSALVEARCGKRS